MTENQHGRSSTFYTKNSGRTIKIHGDFQDFPEGFLNPGRFPGFPGVVDTLM